MSWVSFARILYSCAILVPVDSTGPGLAFVSQPVDVTVAEQCNVTISCIARSESPSVTYTWTRNGTTLNAESSSERYQLNDQDGNLTIINTNSSDVGAYRCIASNHFGSALSLKADLRIAYLHGHSPTKHTITASMLSTITLPVSKVTSYPTAVFTWSRRKRHSRGFDVIGDGQNGRLLISLSGDLYIVGVASGDAGTFRCAVSNPLVGNEVIIDFELFVLEGVVDRQLSILGPPSSVAAFTGAAQVVFECIVSSAVTGGRPQVPEITWHKNNTELNPNQDHKYGFPNGGISRHKLIIYEVEFSDQDVYWCLATTKSDEIMITSPPAQLTVNHKPVLPSLTAYFPPTMYPLVGEQIFLDLRLSAGSISWYKDAVNIAWLPITRLSISPNGSLLVRNVTGVDDGLYQAFAWTSAGEVSTSPVRIHVVEPLLSTTLAPLPSVFTTVKTLELTTEVASHAASTSLTDQRTKQSEGSLRTHSFLYGTVTSNTSHHSGNKANHYPHGRRTVVLYCSAAAAVVIFTLAVAAVSCFTKRRSKARQRQGSVKLKCQTDQDSEEFELEPVAKRNAAQGRPGSLSAPTHGNSDSTSDLLGSCSSADERRVSLDANDNPFITEFRDHASEFHIVVVPEQSMSLIPNTSTCQFSGDRQATEEPSEVGDEISLKFRHSPGLSLFQFSDEYEKRKDRIPFQRDSCVCTERRLCEEHRGDRPVIDTGATHAQEQAAEPLYYVLEEPGGYWGSSLDRETGSGGYQSLVQRKSTAIAQMDSTGDEDRGGGFAERFVSYERYHSLTPLNHDDALKDESSFEVAMFPPSKYQALLHEHSMPQLSTHQDWPRSISGVYQPLARSLHRHSSLLQRSEEDTQRLIQIYPESEGSVKGEVFTEPIYDALDDEERCPLNYDEREISFSQKGRRSPPPSALDGRRALQEPTYMAVHVGSSQTHGRGSVRSAREPRYSPTPGRKQVLDANIPPGHRRSLSDSGHTLYAVVHDSSPERSNHVPVRNGQGDTGHNASSPGHREHRRNVSDIGRCPIDLSSVFPTSRRPASSNNAVVPRISSLGTLGCEPHRSPRDTTHCRVYIGP